MKKIKFKLTLRVKRPKVEFKEGLGVGVLASEEVEFTVPDNVSETLLAMSINDHRDRLMRENVHVEVEAIE